jgi:hypothetical protein
MQIDTADIVNHGPTGEEWTVAYVKDGRIAWCGWPEGEAALADCTLVKAASDDERIALLKQMAEMSGNDARRTFARWRLGLRT